MSNERSNNPNSAEFAQICMEWLKSNKPTLTVKDRYNDSKLIYVRVPSEGLDYIYNISTYWLRANPNETGHFGYNAVYSPTAEICVFNGFLNRDFTIPKEELVKETAMGFYESKGARTKFDEVFEKVFPSIFLAKYQDKVTLDENASDYYTDAAKKAYLRGEDEVSLLEMFYEQIKTEKIYLQPIESLLARDSTESYRILIDFIAKGQTEETMREFIEKALTSCEKETPHVFTKMYGQFMNYLKRAKAVYNLSKAYLPTKDEKLTRSMCQAYHAFFKDKEPPRKIKITVMGANKNRNWRSERDNIDIEGKIMTMKVDPCRLASPYVAFEPSTYGVSDFTCKDLQVRKNYSGRIEFPLDDIHTEDILKIEYGRKTIWEKPAKEAI
jgi:hypothetical protein|nr:MAG TPA: hypothetical protein [Caudoviricetes sp.]